MRKIPLEERRKTFKEVALGFKKEEAIKEAKRCLQCKTPSCIKGCPVEVDIKGFIKFIAQGKFGEAIKKIREKNSLPAVCGRVCPQENLCQKSCLLNKKGAPIKIGYLERFVADWERENKKRAKPKLQKRRKEKIAVIGSGPAGLTFSSEMAKRGFKVTLFEALHKVGGVLRYGIPEFRLPKKILDREIEYIKSLKVEIRIDFFVGKTKTVEELKKEGFKLFFLAIGAGSPKFLGIEGESLNQVYSANEFLVRINLMKSYLFPRYHTPIKIGEKVGVIGAGNVAFDCARVALRLGKEVFIIYRRGEEEMPARKEEIENAKEEGVKFIFLATPKKIISDEKGNVKGIVCLKNELREEDSTGRRTPYPLEGSEFLVELDTVIVAIGTKPNPLIKKIVPDIELTEDGYIKVNEYFQTSVPYIFAGGDIVSGNATVINAIHQAKKAAFFAEKFLKKCMM